MQSLVRLIIVLSVLASVFVSYGDTETIDGITWRYSVKSGEAILGDIGNCAISVNTSGAIVLPSMLGGYPVTSIGSSAFKNCSRLTSVTIGNGVTSIGEQAFYNCDGLTSVTIPDNVTSIGEEAFDYCSSLTSVTIPDSVTSIGEGAFENCNAALYDNVTISGVKLVDGWVVGKNSPSGDLNLIGVRGISGPAFSGCRRLTSVTIGNGVTSIGKSAFSGCSGLKSVTIIDSVTSIGSDAFSGCSELKSVTIPDSVTSIGSDAFSGCSGLTSVTITDIAKWCGISFGNHTANPFCYASKLYLNDELLSELMLPDSVTSIGSYAFYRCRGLTSVTIPDSVTSIGDYAFSSCSGLTSVTIPDSVTSIGSSAFSSCSGLTSVTIGNGVTSIGDEAFYNCTSLQQLTIPDGVTSYGADCFERCPVYRRSLYRAIFNGNSGGGSPVVVTTVVQNVEAPYDLSNQAADRAIASVTVSDDCSIDSFVLKDGKVYDSLLYVRNTAEREVVLSLPGGYSYKTIKGAKPLVIPALSQCLISITRVEANVFLVMREELDDVK